MSELLTHRSLFSFCSFRSKETTNENTRTLTSFTREVAILRSLASPSSPPHPSLITHITSFTTPTHHALVLPFLPGGELFAVVEREGVWACLGMGWVKRVWGELEDAVGWLNRKGVVHRDIKLESALS
jgi:protein-serine/threonine kinase